jgi:hypothetical protein
LISVLLADYKFRLTRALEVCLCTVYDNLNQATAKALPRMDDDDRLKPVLNNMSKHYLGKDYGASERPQGEVSHSDVEKVCKVGSEGFNISSQSTLPRACVTCTISYATIAI